MDFNLSEDVLRIDCMNFVDSSSNAPGIMREICGGGEKIAYQESPQTSSNPSKSITSMLIDEAPDNFLSSTALEKNIFSDDDEYGLQRLKRSDKNFDKPLWENDFNTDDLIKKESDLGLDLVNFPPPPPAPPPTQKVASKVSNSSQTTQTEDEAINSDGGNNMDEDSSSESEESESDADADAHPNANAAKRPILLYEVMTNSKSTREGADSRSMKRRTIGRAEDNSRADADVDNERDEKYFAALNDHNYISSTSFGSVIHYATYYMTNAEKKQLLNVLGSKRVDNGAIVTKAEPEDANSTDDEEEDDEQASLATTDSFNPSEGRNESEDDGEESAGSDDENIAHNDAGCGRNISYERICKRELIIDDQREMLEQYPSQSTSELSSEDHDHPELKRIEQARSNEIKNEQMPGIENVLREEEAESIVPETSEPIQFLSQTLVPPREAQDNFSEKSKANDDTSSASLYFSENRSEPIEFHETEDNSSSADSEEDNASDEDCHSVIKMNKNIEDAEQTIEKEIIANIPDKVNSSLNASNEPPEELICEDVKEAKNRAEGDNGVKPTAVNLISDNPKLFELKTFATRLLNYCEEQIANEKLDEAFEALLKDFQEILGKRPTADKSMQTEKLYSKEKRSKMNEKAKRKLLNASSSSSDSSCASSDDEEVDDARTYEKSMGDENNRSHVVDEEVDGVAGEDEKLEKSPSYSDLSGRASSEEFLNNETDDNELRSNSDGLDLSKYIVHSDKASSVKSDNMDVSNCDNGSEIESCTVDDQLVTDSLNKDVENEFKVEDGNPEIEADDERSTHETHDMLALNEDHDADVPESAADLEDEEMADVDKEANELDRLNEAVEARSDVELNSDNESKEGDDMHVPNDSCAENTIENDEKLKLEAKVVINKLSDVELEEYYDSLREKEIHRLLSYSGLIKKRTNETVPSSSDKLQPVAKSNKTKKLMEILKETENDVCSDESTSDIEEEQLTEHEFLKLCNKNAKDDILKSSSSDSELDAKASDGEGMDAINLSGYSSSDDEEGPSIVDKFLEKFASQVGEEESELNADNMEEDAAPHVSNDKPVEEQAVVEADIACKDELSESKKPESKEEVGVIEDGIEIGNDSCELSSADDMSDDVELVQENTSEVAKRTISKEKDEPGVETGKRSASGSVPSSSSGMARYIRSLLTEDKGIDIDAIENEPVIVPEKEKDDTNLSLARQPATTKSLETMIEESRRRQNAKSSDNAPVVNLDSDSDLEELSNEPEVRKRSIKPMLRKDQLAGETRVAQRRESERLKRLEKKNEMLAKKIQEYRNDADVSIETDELILDYNSETNNFIKVHPDIVKHLKPHQIDGIKFMYDNTYGSVDNLKKNPGSGCILAHCMGLGKTLQIVALLHTVITYKELDTSKILVLCPKSTVMNWADEIRRWLGPAKCGNLKIFSFNDASSTSIEDKIKILREWSSSGMPGYRRAGCLLLGYEAFRMLVFNPLHKKRIISAAHSDKIKQIIRDTLLDPGADLVICDEGHIIKNRKSATSSAVSELNTLRRIILTGTPIQNNLKEYYAMVNFIKPKFLGTEKEFANLYENPIRNGQHKDSNKRDIKIMKQRSFVLHKKLSKFVQRREAALLKTFLPMKFEYVLFIPMTDVQIKLYEYFLEVSSKREGSKGKTLIPDYTCLRKIWTHPRVLENAWKNAVLKNKQTNKKSPIREPNSDDEVPDDVYDTQTGALSVTDDWWRSLLTDDNLQSILPSSKLQVMFEILRMCTENREKCLIFSAFVAVLDCVEYFMNQINNQGEKAREYGLTKYQGPWESGKDYYRLDGKTPKNIRHEMVKRFNDPKMTRARVFLISAKAGGQGINLIGANRVMILDTSWNPSNDQQNIFRVFRLGQKRQCYVYRLLAMGTMEEKVYSRSVTKQAMSFRVVDEQQIDRHYSMAELTELYTLTKADYQNRPVPPLPQDSILASLLRNCPHLVYKYHEHDSLLENKLEQELSEQEKADAWDAYERDLQSSQNPELMPGMNNIPPMYQNSPFFPPGLAYGYGADRNYPMGYGSSLPPGYLASLGYSSNSSLMDMLKMFPSPPSMPGMNAGLPGSSQGNMMHPYSAGFVPPSVSNQSAHPMGLPTFSSLQNMVSSTGVSSMPSYTSPYSSMANSYNMPPDPALLRLSQMYASSLGVGTSGGSMSRIDSRSPPGMPHRTSPSINAGNDKRISPFPTGLMPPSSVAESIPTSVIKPPQAHSASTPRHSMPMPSLAQQLSQTLPGQYSTPGSGSNNEIPSLQQQLLSQSRLPPPGLQSILQNHMSKIRLPEMPMSRMDSTPGKSRVDSTPAKSRVDSTPSKSPIINTTVASAVPSIISSMNTSGSNRNSSPVTVPQRNSPQMKSPSSGITHRATNMGIVYPPESNAATITPILSTSTAASAPTNSISVRSVSSINSGSGAKNTIPANIIPKPGAAASGNVQTYLKSNNVIVPNSTISANTSMTVSPVGKQPNAANMTKQTANQLDKSQSSPNLAGSSLLTQLRHLANISQKPDKSGAASSEAAVEKATIQILGSNNVQLTKVPNSRSVLSKSQSNLASIGRVQSPITGAAKGKGAQPQTTSGPSNSVITAGRPTSGLTVLPLPNNSNAKSGTNTKVIQNNTMNAVPTLVPLSSKTNSPTLGRPTILSSGKISTNTPPSITNPNVANTGINHLKLTNVLRTNSPTQGTILKKLPGKVGRPLSQMAKVVQPTSTPPPSVATYSGSSLKKRGTSLGSLPANKQARSPINIAQTPRHPGTLPPGQKQASIAKITNVSPGKLQTTPHATIQPPSAGASVNSSNKNSLSIRSIDAINKFASVGITISPGKSKAIASIQNCLVSAMNHNMKNAKGINNTNAGNLNNLSNSVTLSKVVGSTTATRKRPSASLIANNSAIASQSKKPRITPTVTERNVAESLLRARSNQGLTILLKNPQGNQKTTKDGKVTDVVEID